MKFFFLKKVKDSPWARLFFVARVILTVVIAYYIYAFIYIGSLDCIKCAESAHSWEALLDSLEQGTMVAIVLALSLFLLLFL